MSLRPPAQGVDYSPPTAVRRCWRFGLSAAVRHSRVVGADGSPCSPGSASKFADPFSVLHIRLISEKLTRPSSIRDRKDTDHLKTCDLQDADRFAGGGAGGHNVVD